MRLLGKLAPGVEERRADEVQVDDCLAGGAYQRSGMSNARAGERVLEVTEDGGLVYIVGDRAPGYAWTLTSDETVMIEKEK